MPLCNFTRTDAPVPSKLWPARVSPVTRPMLLKQHLRFNDEPDFHD